MRIVVWGINYAPELTGIGPYNTGLCDYLAQRGHQVAMVTAFPYYPSWKKNAGDHRTLYRIEQWSEIPVHRCWLYTPHRLTTVRRILHELSFGLTSFLRVLTLRKADIYVVVSPPLLLGVMAWMITCLKGSRYVFHVQDLQPDSARGLGMLKPGPFVSFLYAVEAFIYRNAATVSGISDSMLEAFKNKGVPAHKRWQLPNWLIHKKPPASAQPSGFFRATHGIPPGAFLAIYSGNLGRKQGLPILIETARRLMESARMNLDYAVHIVIAGDGAIRAELEKSLRDAPIARCHLLPLLPESVYQAMLAEADVALITQETGTGRFFAPSKLLSVLSAGLPVLAVADVDSDLSQAIIRGKFGVRVSPNDADLLAETLIDLSRRRAELKVMATEGLKWASTFQADKILGEFEEKLNSLAEEQTSTPVARRLS